MRPGDRLVCAFIDLQAPGDQFKQWPLHVTVVPWFRVDVGSGDLADQLRETLCYLKAFQVVMGDEGSMGRDKTVNMVSRPTPFIEIEEAVRSSLKGYSAWLVDETTKRRRDYQPHVTAQPGQRLYRGDTFMCQALYIVEQKGEHKEVVATIELAA